MNKNSPLSSVLVKIAGIDKETLDTCVKSERIKQIGYGTLILIPVIMGFISMTFAISTLTKNNYLPSIFGIIWAAIILIIDRYMISSYRKSDRIIDDIFSIKFTIRIILSIFLGIITSHPLVLYIFSSTIQENLSKLREKEIFDVRTKYNNNKKHIENDLSDYYKNHIERLDEEINCLSSIASFEQSGKIITLSCAGTPYTTSGKLDPGKRFRFYQRKIDSLSARRVTFIENFNLKKIDSDSLINVEENKSKEEVKNLSINFSEDYLKKSIILSNLSANDKIGHEVNRQSNFLIIFFILLDIIPVLLKTLSKKSEYDIKIEKNEENSIYQYNYQLSIEKDIETIKKEKTYSFRKNEIINTFTSSFETLEDLNNHLNSL